MQPIDLGNEVGFVEVTVKAGDGSDVTKKIDLWETNNRLFDLARGHQGKPAPDYHKAVADYLESLGFPRVSHYRADRFVVAINEAVESLKKTDAGGPKPDSPASTESTPST